MFKTKTSKIGHLENSRMKKLEKDYLPRLEKYEQQEKTFAGRNSYAKTDEDASCIRLKEDWEAEKLKTKPAYNIQIGTEGQFIVGYSCPPEGWGHLVPDLTF